MTDRELLEFAAKAAGLSGEWSTTIGGWDCLITAGHHVWQPLHDDGDALRLASDLGLSCQFTAYYSVCYAGSPMAKQFTEKSTGDGYAATRRAIVRAAAAIGEKMP